MLPWELQPIREEVRYVVWSSSQSEKRYDVATGDITDDFVGMNSLGINFIVFSCLNIVYNLDMIFEGIFSKRYIIFLTLYFLCFN